MRLLSDIPQMCTALIFLTQQGVLGLVCAAGIRICSWKGRLCQCVVRQKEIKREFLHSICTQHAFQIKSDSLLSLKNADCNNQILAGEETAKAQSYRSRSKFMSLKMFLKYLNRIRGKSKNEMSNAPEAAWNLTIWCIYFLLHYILWFAGIYANKIKLLTIADNFYFILVQYTPLYNVFCGCPPEWSEVLFVPSRYFGGCCSGRERQFSFTSLALISSAVILNQRSSATTLLPHWE